MVSRMTLILWLLQAKRVFYLYEQPGSSLLWYHPDMERFAMRCAVYRAWTWMGSFGADSPKGTCLWSSRASVQKLSRVLPDRKFHEAQITKETTNKDGTVSVSGGRDLKASQAYTAEFGFSTLSVWLAEDEIPEPELETVSIPNIWAPLSKKERWEGANLVEVMQYLTIH